MAYSIAISMVKNPQDTEDVVQNAFVSTYKSIRSFNQQSKFSSWFYRIVVNESLKQIKKNKVKHNYETINEDIFDLGSSFNDAVEQLDLNEKKGVILKVLSNMKPKEALILKLFYLNEFSIKEIEASTGFMANNIKVLLHRARKSFMGHYLNISNEK